MTTIRDVVVHDVRFPTAAAGDGSDAINRGDYSATYVELHTDEGVTGTGLTFTNGRGNELTCAAVEALAHHVAGRRVEDLAALPLEFLAR
jgi:L-fuconate dehydratase